MGKKAGRNPAVPTENPDTEVEATEVEEVEPTEEEGGEALSYPTPLKDLKGADRERAKVWNSQARAGTVFICKDDKCYHPCVHVRSERDHSLLIEKTPKGDAFVMKCSWDPRHAGGRQLHLIPQKDDVLDKL